MEEAKKVGAPTTAVGSVRIGNQAIPNTHGTSISSSVERRLPPRYWV